MLRRIYLSLMASRSDFCCLIARCCIYRPHRRHPKIASSFIFENKKKAELK